MIIFLILIDYVWEGRSVAQVCGYKGIKYSSPLLRQSSETSHWLSLSYLLYLSGFFHSFLLFIRLFFFFFFFFCFSLSLYIIFFFLNELTYYIWLLVFNASAPLFMSLISSHVLGGQESLNHWLFQWFLWTTPSTYESH